MFTWALERGSVRAAQDCGEDDTIKGNAVKDICSRIHQNLDFFELDPNSGEFGYVEHPVFSSVQNTSWH